MLLTIDASHAPPPPPPPHTHTHTHTHTRSAAYASVNQVGTGSDKGLSSGRRQAIIYSNAGLLLIGSLGSNLSELLIKIQNFILQKCIWKYRRRDIASAYRNCGDDR